MALSPAITTSRLTQAYQQSPFERISARIYDFSSFFSGDQDWIDKNCTHFTRPGKRIREFIRDKRDRWNIYIYMCPDRWKFIEVSNFHRCVNYITLIILLLQCREIIRKRHTHTHTHTTKSPLARVAKDSWPSEHTSRPIHPDVFSPPCARRCNIFRSSVCVLFCTNVLGNYLLPFAREVRHRERDVTNYIRVYGHATNVYIYRFWIHLTSQHSSSPSFSSPPPPPSSALPLLPSSLLVSLE